MWNWRYSKTLFKNVNKNSQITCVDPNNRMIKKGKEKLKNIKILKWIIASAEKLTFK